MLYQEQGFVVFYTFRAPRREKRRNRQDDQKLAENFLYFFPIARRDILLIIRGGSSTTYLHARLKCLNPPMTMTRRRRQAPLVPVSPAARPASALRVPGSPAARPAPAAPTLDVRLHLPWPVLDLLRDLALPLLVISISFSVVAWVLAFRISCLPAPDAIAAGIGNDRRHLLVRDLGGIS